MWQDYVFPKSIKDALYILDNSIGRARIIAGGTNLIFDMKGGSRRVDTLVDLSKIKALSRITEEDGVIKIGANVTCAQVAASNLVKQKAPALSQGASKMGSRQIRNVATIAGNIVQAQPVADTAIPLVSLGAMLEIEGPDITRTIPIMDAYTAGLGGSTIDAAKELVAFIYVPVQKIGEGSSCIRTDERYRPTFPMRNLACKVSIEDEFIHSAVITMGSPYAREPLRVMDAELRLIKNRISPQRIRSAAQRVAGMFDPDFSLLGGFGNVSPGEVSEFAERAINQAIACARA